MKRLPYRHHIARFSVLISCTLVGLSGCSSAQQSTTNDEVASQSATPANQAKQPTDPSREQANEPADLKSLSLTREDRDQLYNKLVADLADSDILKQWRDTEESSESVPVVVLPFTGSVRNARFHAQSIGGKLEVFLVNDSPAAVVSPANLMERYATYEQDNPDAPRIQSVAIFARELPAKFAFIGELNHDKKPTPDAREITYTATIEIVDAKSEEVAYTTSATLTKSR